ncbi:ABC transporter substrate-binding protein [Chelatococcus reniformis]|uniref:ABC transporter substrate-binding protein n=1 Tax=Chelatococcus reniformis TaxID=1494448 RepID=A0A916UT19_9HYPH|nr:ABC transporter substrate-binding protein [Chelatococcus reniformis]GGC86993.1 ABC transporter substrate-binding protein [Chelatococcus reniformis]
MKPIRALVCAVLMAPGLATAARSEILIGSVLSTTGPASFLGEPEKQTLEVYAKRINDAGGVNGEKIRLIIYDDGSDASNSRTFATRLVEQDQVVAVVGGTGTGNSLAMIPVFEEAGIPFVSLSGGVDIIDPVRKWVFKPPHTDRMACAKIFTDLKQRGLTNAAFIAGQGGYAKSMVTQCRSVAGQYGIKILAEESYGPRDSDMTAQLTRIKALPGLKAVINADIGQGPAIVTRNAAQINLGMPLYQSHGAATQGYLELAGPAAEGVRLPGPSLLVAEQLPDSDPQKKVLLDYTAVIEKATGKPVGTFGGYAHDGLLLLVDAMKRAGSADPAKVRDQLEKTKGYVATVGIITMSPTDHLGIDLSAFRMLEVKRGKWAVVD